MKDCYIFRYIIILVIIVSVLLSGTAVMLQPLQQRNIDNEKMTMILKAAGITDIDANNAKKTFDEYCKTMLVIDENGDVVEGHNAFKINMKDELYKKTNNKNFYLPIFVIDYNNLIINVIPLQGNGLWGPIWGYIGLSSDYTTVVGAVFDHKSETPGLGAEITTKKFQSQFAGKTIFQNGKFVSIDVVKGGIITLSDDLQRHSVDAISGGTITSRGVNDMIYNVLESYLPYIEKQ